MLLLNSVIFNYHGLDEEEQKILEHTAQTLEAAEELKWVQEFIQKDIPTLFDRAREFFKETILTYDKETKVYFLNTVWVATNKKGHITEMEAMAILKLAKDWGVQRDLLALVRR
jgi:tRNA splicing ligase